MKNRKHRKKAKKPSSRPTPQSILFSVHPLSGRPHDEIIPGLIEAAKASKIQFQENLRKTLSLLATTEPLGVISACAFYGCFAGISLDGKVAPFMKQPLGQADAELIQALSLKRPYEDYGGAPLDPQILQVIFDVIPELGTSFAQQRMTKMEEDQSDQQKAINLVQEHLRLNTQAVRNWGFLDRVVEITNELLSPLDSNFMNAFGISATQIISVFMFLLRRAEDRANAWRDQLRRVFSEKTAAGMVRRYYEVNPQFTDSWADMVKKIENLRIDQLKILILAHSNLRLTDVFTFDVAPISKRLGISSSHLEGVLGRLSIAF